MRVDGRSHIPAVLAPRKGPDTYWRKLGVPQFCSVRSFRKINSLSPTEDELLTP
jgi:hypothetical protein